jgi:hypothetical protein
MPPEISGGVYLGFMYLPWYRAWVVLAAFVICVSIWFGIERTKLGATLPDPRQSRASHGRDGAYTARNDLPGNGMRLFIRCFAFVGLVALAGLTAPAAHADDLDLRLKPLISEQYATEFMQKALKGIHYLNCDGVPCRRTDEFELFNPPLSTADTRMVLVYGIKGALAWWCGLDEGRGTVALGEFLQEREFNARQEALASAMHGTFMRMQKAVYDTSGKSCQEETKAELDEVLPKGVK